MNHITLRYSGYYTHFSFLLFLISFALPFSSKIKYFILINSIIVGIAGNFIYMNDYDTFCADFLRHYPTMTQSEINQQLSYGNLICHTIPMIISFLLLPHCTPYIQTYSDSMTFFIYEMLAFFLWSLLPYRNSVVEEKVSHSYPSTAFAIMVTFVTSLVVVFSIAFFHENH